MRKWPRGSLPTSSPNPSSLRKSWPCSTASIKSHCRPLPFLEPEEIDRLSVLPIPASDERCLPCWSGFSHAPPHHVFSRSATAPLSSPAYPAQDMLRL